MKIEVYSETSKKEEIIYFRLVKEEQRICLVVCDSKGGRYKDGEILRINPEGNLALYCGVNPTLGLQLDEDGQIKVF